MRLAQERWSAKIVTSIVTDFLGNGIKALISLLVGSIANENTLFGSNSILFKKDDEDKKKLEVNEVKEEPFDGLIDDISKELDELLVKKEVYNDDEKMDDKEKNTEDEDLLGFIDSTLYKEGDE